MQTSCAFFQRHHCFHKIDLQVSITYRSFLDSKFQDYRILGWPRTPSIESLLHVLILFLWFLLAFVVGTCDQVMKLAAVRIRNLCERLRQSHQIVEQVYRALQHILNHETSLFFNRHIDQLILCSLYGVCKVRYLCRNSYYIMQCLTVLIQWKMASFRPSITSHNRLSYYWLLSWRVHFCSDKILSETDFANCW